MNYKAPEYSLMCAASRFDSCYAHLGRNERVWLVKRLMQSRKEIGETWFLLPAKCAGEIPLMKGNSHGDRADRFRTPVHRLPDRIGDGVNMIVTIVAPFIREPALVGERVEITAGPNVHGEVEAKLLGNSEYIREHTDGYVILLPGEYAA
jgi:hypothetical protein